MSKPDFADYIAVEILETLRTPVATLYSEPIAAVIRRYAVEKPEPTHRDDDPCEGAG
jgi:hypothetical protein